MPGSVPVIVPGCCAACCSIGGVLEITPLTGWFPRWADELGMDGAELWRRLEDVSRAGSIGTITEADYAAAVESRLGLTPDGRDRFLADLWEEYLGTPNTELIDWFAALRPRYRTGIVSNSFVGARERERERYGFEDLCDTIVYSHEVGAAKPDPAIYLEACRRLDVPPGETVFVDDHEGPVEGARAIGMTAVLHTDTAGTIAELNALLD